MGAALPILPLLRITWEPEGGSPGELPAPGHTSIMDAAQQGMGQLLEPLPHSELTGEQAEQLTGGANDQPLQMRWLGLEAGQGCRSLHTFRAGVHTCTLSPTSSPTSAPEEVLPVNVYCPQAQTRNAEGLASPDLCELASRPLWSQGLEDGPSCFGF